MNGQRHTHSSKKNYGCKGWAGQMALLYFTWGGGGWKGLVGVEWILPIDNGWYGSAMVVTKERQGLVVTLS